MLVATHDPVIASRCDRIVRLRDGRILDVTDVQPEEAAAVLERVTRLEAVIGFLASALRNRPWRAERLALGILAAAVAFVLLTGSAATSALRIQGTLKSNYRNAYDILVRPKGSTTPLERQQGLVRPNFLSGIYGGSRSSSTTRSSRSQAWRWRRRSRTSGRCSWSSR